MALSYDRASLEPDAGLLPDLLVEPTLTDILQGRDPALIAAIQSIAMGKNPGGG